MLVDNPLQQPFFPSSSSSSSMFTDYTTDLSEFLNTDLFASGSNNSNSPATASTSSRASSPQSPFQPLLTTPPPSSLPTSFPDVQDSFSYGGTSNFDFSSSLSSSSFFNFLGDDSKVNDPMLMSINASASPYDFLGTLGGGGGSSSMDMSMDSALLPSAAISSAAASSSAMSVGIDPQLVGTPSTQAMSDFDEDEEHAAEEEEAPKEKLTLTIAPVKVAGHGKARKGTVQSGGVVKKTSSAAAPPPAASVLISSVTTKEKENHSAKSRFGSAGPKGGDDEDDDDDLPADWRPPPEVFQKMTSKEKRQLRNKISARNFRVRRKEYINTLEMDIAERDRILQAIRSELGSSQSENNALRQEITALKKALLEGRTGALTSEDVPALNLPPPAPLPPLSFSAGASAAATAASAQLLAPNTRKDLPTPSSNASPRLGAFWGGVSNVGLGMGGGITPVHTVLMPELSTLAKTGNGAVRAALQENINPALNGTSGSPAPFGGRGMVGGFDGFADVNPFTMKTLDAYRMQLWTKMASQHAHNNNQHYHQHPQQHTHYHNSSPPPLISSPSPFTASSATSSSSPPYTYPSPSNSPLQLPAQLTGLASNLKPHYFVSSNKANLPTNTPPTPAGSTLGALLAGKHPSSSSHCPYTSSSSSYPSPPASPPLGGFMGRKDSPASASQIQREKEMQKARDTEQAQAMIAAMVGQTLLKRLGSAFWDAFSGSSGSGSSTQPGAVKGFDAEKVRKVLEGKAVVRIVDVEGPTAPPMSPPVMRAPARVTTPTREHPDPCISQAMCAMLEESMSVLSLGKK